MRSVLLSSKETCFSQAGMNHYATGIPLFIFVHFQVVKVIDMGLHRRHTRTVQCIRQVAPMCRHLMHSVDVRTLPMLPPAESLWVYRPPNMSWHVLGRPLFTFKIVPSYSSIWTHIYYVVRFPNPSQHLERHRDGSAAFAGLTVMTE